MGNEWSTCKFSELYAVPSRNGLTKPKKVRGSGYKFINMGEIFAYDRMSNIPCDRVPVTDKELKTSLLKNNDLLFARQSLVLSGAGKCSIFLGDNEPVVFESHLIRVRPNENIVDPQYLFYFFKSPLGRAEIWSITEQGAGQAGIRGSDLETITVLLPEREEQKAIAHVLGALDDRIELNRRMNETLEGMAQALFKSWFVDFDPVIDNAMALGKEIPAELSERAAARAALGDKRKPLPEEIRTLFPNEFTHSTVLGWIPKGWEVASFSKYAVLNQASWTKNNSPENVQYVDLANTKNGKVNLVVPYTFSDAPSRARRILKKYDTIVGTVRPGNRSFAFIHGEGLTGSTGFAVMSPKERHVRAFIYLALTRDEVIDNFAHLADGAAYPAVRPDVVANTEAVFPSHDLMRAFDTFAYPWIEKMGQHDMGAGALANLRDTLLPKLLSGEIRIPDAEKLVEGLT